MKGSRDFRFKQFTIMQRESAHKVGTDGVLLGAWADVTGVTKVLDVGTGTGLIALMIAQRNQNAVIDAIEINERDFDQARGNAAASPWSDRVHVHHVALQEFRAGHFDLIISNPPFFVNSLLSPDSGRSAARHAHSLPSNAFLQHAFRFMNPTGRLAVVLPPAEGTQFFDLALAGGLRCRRYCEVRSRPHKPIERLLLEFDQSTGDTAREEIVIHAEGDSWSDRYVDLTRDFYLKL